MFLNPLDTEIFGLMRFGIILMLKAPFPEANLHPSVVEISTVTSKLPSPFGFVIAPRVSFIDPADATRGDWTPPVIWMRVVEVFRQVADGEKPEVKVHVEEGLNEDEEGRVIVKIEPAGRSTGWVSSRVREF